MPLSAPGRRAELTQGNAIRWLADNEDGWTVAAQLIQNATILDVMQLTIDVGAYQVDETKEKPKVILAFDPATLLVDPTKPLGDPGQKPTAQSNPRAIDLADQRIERLILDRFQHGVDVRIQIPKISADPKIFLLGATAALAAGTGIFLLGTLATLHLDQDPSGVGARADRARRIAVGRPRPLGAVEQAEPEPRRTRPRAMVQECDRRLQHARRDQSGARAPIADALSFRHSRQDHDRPDAVRRRRHQERWEAGADHRLALHAGLLQFGRTCDRRAETRGRPQ